jgi:hypothetical protein
LAKLAHHRLQHGGGHHLGGGCLVSGSVALVSFGVDSGIEVRRVWRPIGGADTYPERPERAERVTHRIIGGSFLALSGYVTVESLSMLA